ncbi:MAG TPA: hypothetical protein VGJ22_02500 [Anaerolineales bacterium]|jgi:FtsH-binding integral membrane protein
MKVNLPHPQHASYLAHRRQVIWQVILPMVLAVLLLIGFALWISFATFRGGADVGRWAAISTIWIVLPVLLAGLIVLVLLLGINYLVMRLRQITPTYTGLAQDYVFRGAAVVKRVTKAAVEPIFLIDRLVGNMKGFIGRR